MTALATQSLTSSSPPPLSPQVEDANKNEIGFITKKWSGVLREVLTDTDRFGVNFPAEIPLEHKILLLATALLIDLSLFENQEGFAD